MRVVSIVENGGGCAEYTIVRARSPIWERPGLLRRRAVMIEAQKRAGSLSSSSRESQETWYADCAAQVESSVVFPAPAEAEHNSNRCSRTASRAFSNRSRLTSVEGGRGRVYLVSNSSALP